MGIGQSQKALFVDYCEASVGAHNWLMSVVKTVVVCDDQRIKEQYYLQCFDNGDLLVWYSIMKMYVVSSKHARIGYDALVAIPGITKLECYHLVKAVKFTMMA